MLTGNPGEPCLPGRPGEPSSPFEEKNEMMN